MILAAVRHVSALFRNGGTPQNVVISFLFPFDLPPQRVPDKPRPLGPCHSEGPVTGSAPSEAQLAMGINESLIAEAESLKCGWFSFPHLSNGAVKHREACALNWIHRGAGLLSEGSPLRLDASTGPLWHEMTCSGRVGASRFKVI